MNNKSRLISLIITIALIISLGCTSFANADMLPPDPITYTVTYDLQGGVLDSGSLTEIVASSGTYNAMPAFSRAGYEFSGWYTGSGGSGSLVKQGDSLAFSENHTLYAKWVEKMFTVSFDAQGGNPDVEKLTKHILFGIAYGELPTTTRPGYIFGGWYTEPNGAGTEVTANTPTTIPANHTLYAKWNGNVYGVNFDLQGGTLISGDDSKTVIYGTEYGTLPVAEKATYIFGGWWTEPDGAGNEITSTTQVTITDTQTLYAKWTRPVFNITYDPQGGTLNTDSLIWTYTYGENYGILLTPVYPGYIFTNWYTEPNGGTPVTVFDKVSIPNDHTLYARWIPKTYTVTLDLQDINADTATLNCTFASAYGPLPTPTRQNYTFEGWYTASGNNGTLVTAETIVSTTRDHTLYAKWTGDSYTVTLDPQDGEVTPTTLSREYGSAYELPTPTRPYHRFNGWYTASDDSGTLVTAETIVSTTQDHTLYAKWTPASIAVTFDLQGGEMEQTIHYYNLGEQYGTLPEPTRIGYEFFGWCTTRDVSSTWVRDSGIVSIPTDHTLYAYWVRKVFIITFDIGEGSFRAGENATKYVSYGAEYGSLPFGEKQNYILSGWWTESGGRGNQITSSTQVTLTADQTLYAKWTLDYTPPLPYMPPPPPPPIPPRPPLMIPPTTEQYIAQIIPPFPPPPQPPPVAGFAPNIVTNFIPPAGTQRILPGAYDSETGRFSFLYDTLPEDTGNSSITMDYSQTPPSGISQNHWAYQDAAMLLSQGILDGGPIAPGTTMTRIALIDMLRRSVAFPLNPTNGSNFSDTTNDDTAINWAAERGIINGFPDGTFRQNTELTRQEAFVIITRFLKAYGINPPDSETGSASQEFSDTGDIDDWARNDISTLAQYGIVRGTPGVNGPALNPLRGITQEEMIALISRTIGICY